MRETGEALICAAQQVLALENAGHLGCGGDMEEFAQAVCMSMGVWGYCNLALLAEDRRTLFLQLVSHLVLLCSLWSTAKLPGV